MLHAHARATSCLSAHARATTRILNWVAVHTLWGAERVLENLQWQCHLPMILPWAGGNSSHCNSIHRTVFVTSTSLKFASYLNENSKLLSFLSFIIPYYNNFLRLSKSQTFSLRKIFYGSCCASEQQKLQLDWRKDFLVLNVIIQTGVSLWQCQSGLDVTLTSKHRQLHSLNLQ